MARAEVLIATTNQAKYLRLSGILQNLQVTHAPLEAERLTPPAEETAETAADVAREKALEYASRMWSKRFLGRRTVLCMDDMVEMHAGPLEGALPGGFKGPVEEEYGEFTPETALRFYGDLVRKNGGPIPVTCHYGVALGWREPDDGRLKAISTSQGLHYQLVAEPSRVVQDGYPLSSLLQVEVADNEHVYESELSPKETELANRPLAAALRGVLLQRGLVPHTFNVHYEE